MRKARNDGQIFRELKVSTWNLRGFAEVKEGYNLCNKITLSAC